MSDDELKAIAERSRVAKAAAAQRKNRVFADDSADDVPALLAHVADLRKQLAARERADEARRTLLAEGFVTLTPSQREQVREALATFAESPAESYERVAEAFWRKHHELAPGKDRPAAMGDSTKTEEEVRSLWNVFLRETYDADRLRTRAALKLLETPCEK